MNRKCKLWNCKIVKNIKNNKIVVARLRHKGVTQTLFFVDGKVDR